MGQDGNVTFYRTSRAADPPALLRDLLQLLAPRHRPLVSRTLAEDREWDAFKSESVDDTPREFFGDSLNINQIPEAFREGRSLTVCSIASALSDRVAEAIRTSVPEAVRGIFLPLEVSLTVGYHDIWENAEHEDGHLFARAFLSVAFFGYGSPNDWSLCRETILRLPDIRDVQAQLERICGPLHQCVYWTM